MHSTEIRRTDWPAALAEFSAAHEGWLVSLDILSGELGAQPEVEDLPLLGIAAEPENQGPVTIALARSLDEHITHSIREPEHIWIERTDAGADAALQIESADGTKAIVRLKTAARPETVDGVPRWP
jgi:hypothetical protein